MLRWAYAVCASLAGAVTALSFRPLRTLTRAEITMAVFVGATFAIFVGPFVVRSLLGATADPKLEAGIYYLMASGSNALIPLAVKKLGQLFNVKPEDTP